MESLIIGDVGTLYRMGVVHTFFQSHLAKYVLLGVTRGNDLERIRSKIAYDERFEKGNMPVQYVPEEK